MVNSVAVPIRARMQLTPTICRVHADSFPYGEGICTRGEHGCAGDPMHSLWLSGLLSEPVDVTEPEEEGSWGRTLSLLGRKVRSAGDYDGSLAP